jgi:hypothetical protein
MARGPHGADDGGMTRRRACRKRLSSAPPLGEGEHVVLTAGVLRGRKGTLVRPARLFLDPGWIVEFDGRPLGLRRLRVATWALGPADQPVPAA